MGTLRLLLAISVVIFHIGGLWEINPVSGKVAVEAFFMISGFYMALILNEKYSSSAKGYYLFISNRALKLYPVYWCVWLLTLVFCLSAYFFLGNSLQLENFERFGSILSLQTWGTIMIANLSLIGQDVFFFLEVDPNTGSFFFSDKIWQSSPQVFDFLLVPQAWSISIELMFYIIAPFVVRKPLYVVGLMIGSFLLRLSLFNYGLQTDPWTYRFFFFELQFFFMGALSYFFYLRIKKTAFLNRRYLDRLAFSVVLLFTIFYQSLPENLYLLPDKFLVFNSSFFVFPFKFWVYSSLLFLAIPFIFRLTKTNKMDRNIGELSYPVYISHMLVIYAFDVLPLTFLTVSIKALAICLLTIGISFLLNKYIAEPIELIRQGRTTKSLPSKVLESQAA